MVRELEAGGYLVAVEYLRCGPCAADASVIDRAEGVGRRFLAAAAGHLLAVLSSSRLD